jgi:O-antigen/teichoic acid export membrane protein
MSTDSANSPEAPPSPAVDLRNSTLARNTAINFIGLAIPYLVAFITMPFVIRMLGVERFGILSLVWLVFGYFGIFDLGLGRATTKYIAEALGKGEVEKLPHYLWTTVLLQLGLAATALVIFYALTPLLAEHILRIPSGLVAETKTTFRLVALSLPINFALNSFRGALEAGQKFGLVNSIKVPASILFYVLPLVGVFLGYHLPGIVTLLILSRLAALAVWLIMCFRVYPSLRTRPAIQRSVLRPLFSFSLWLALSSVLYVVLSSVDRLLIGSLLTVKAVSYYTAPYEILMRLGIIPGSFALMLFPAFSSLTGAGHQARTENLFGRAAKYILMTTGPIFILLIFHSRTFLRLWIGREFAVNSSAVMAILALGFLVQALWTVPYSFLQGSGRADLTTKLQLMETVFYIVMVTLGTGYFGIKGAAVATALRFVIFTSILYLLAFRAGEVMRLRAFLRYLLRPLGVLLGFSAALLASRGLGLGWVGVAASTAALAAAVLFIAFDKNERDFLLARLRVLIPRSAVE